MTGKFTKEYILERKYTKNILKKYTKNIHGYTWM